MSEWARLYYQARATEVGIPSVPPLLDGRIRQLTGVGHPLSADKLGRSFAAAARGVEEYALDGSKIEIGARQTLSEQLWQNIRSLPASRARKSPEEYATSVVARELLRSVSPPINSVEIEALARSEVEESVFRRLIIGNHVAPSNIADPVWVFILARSKTASDRIMAEHMTMVRGSYRQGYLTPRFIGARLLEREFI